jgi:predicted amidohydrolase YtcJ
MVATSGPRAYLNGIIFTANPDQTWAHAMGVVDGRIVAVGTDDDVLSAMGDAERVDLGGTLVLPGFIDGHFHLLMTGDAQQRVELVRASDLSEVQSMVAAHAAANPDSPWVLGRSWLFSQLPGEPTAAMLDEVVSDRPVALDAADYHSCWVNSLGLQELGITDDTPDPAGGRIARDASGKATGFLEETAAQHIAWAYLDSIGTDEQRLTALRKAVEVLNASGITGVIEMALHGPALQAMVTAEDQGWLNVRVVAHWIMSREGDADDHLAQVAEAARLAEKHSSSRLRVAGIKFIVDGTIDGATAHVSHPYTNGAMPDPIWDYDALAPAVAAADAAGLQCALHAIGNAAIHNALNALGNAAKVNGTSGRRHRIEHIEFLDSSDVPRFAELGVTASMQPVHADPLIQDNWREMLGPERIGRGFPAKELVDSGARLVLGTDAPTAPFEPLPNMFIACTRRSAFDPELPPNMPENALPLDDAVRFATAHAAWSCFDEDSRGQLRPGLLADFILVEPDVLAAEPEALLSAQIIATYVEGIEVYRAG